MTTIDHWIDGARTSGASTRTSIVWNPATGQPQHDLLLAEAADVDLAVQAARAAFASWSESSTSTRTSVLFRFRELVSANVDRLAGVISDEHGKVLSDARGEVQRGLDVVEFACGIPTLLKGGYSDQVSTDVDSYSFRQPLGVVAGITPFNFPAMVPMWMFPVAIACGNTFVLKPSERDPVRLDGAGRAVGRGRAPRGRVQRGARRQGRRRRAARPPRGRRHLLRGLDAHRSLRARARHREPASASRPSAGRRTTPSSCPTPTSTSPRRTSAPPPSAPPGSAAWRSPPRWRSAPRATSCSTSWTPRPGRAGGAGAVARLGHGPDRHPRVTRSHRRAHHGRRGAGRQGAGRRSGPRRSRPRGRLLRGPDGPGPRRSVDGRLHERDLRPGAVGAAHRRPRRQPSG